MKALGQKYMGIRPEKIGEEMFKTQEIKNDDGHPVPVSVSTLIHVHLSRANISRAELPECSVYVPNWALLGE